MSTAPPSPFPRDVHRRYCTSLGKSTDTMEYCVTEHLRMSGVYWGVMAMELINAGEEMGKPVRESIGFWLRWNGSNDMG